MTDTPVFWGHDIRQEKREESESRMLKKTKPRYKYVQYIPFVQLADAPRGRENAGRTIDNSKSWLACGARGSCNVGDQLVTLAIPIPVWTVTAAISPIHTHTHTHYPSRPYTQSIMFGYKFLPFVLVALTMTMLSSHVQAAAIPQGNANIEARDVRVTTMTRTKRFPNANVDSDALVSREPAGSVEEIQLASRHIREQEAIFSTLQDELRKHGGKFKLSSEMRRKVTIFFGSVAILAKQLGVQESALA
ncbi:hypothetical protein BT96DRAFT_1024633 [Gymnopus androsaceus JB14]|uniref:Uncharacterized protein n=1 Tax=Gymnopus androsaceus JB14 TaxID=1447944 RepID=A0A6A4GY85_9AGAR|nr:hypothetical protein BT96DRAFT_1024633 [Gymnopus androsaceus JB14]